MTTSDLNQTNRVCLQNFGDEDSGQEGKFLLCRTVSFPEVAEGATMVVMVTDPEASKRTPLSIMNYSSAVLNKRVDLKDVLPLGTFLAIQNPNPKTLLCVNPSEIDLLSQKDVEGIIGQDMKWTPLDNQDDPHSFWTKGNEAIFFFNKLRQCGNKLFLSSCFSDAIRFYDLALQYASMDKDKSLTLSNKAAALLRLGCFNSALEAAQDASDWDSGNVKAVYRLASALVGLDKYGMAVDVLRDRIATFSLQKDKETLEELLKMAEIKRDAPSTPSPELYIGLQKMFTLYGHYSDPHVSTDQEKFQNIQDPHLLKELLDSVKGYMGPVELKKCPVEGKGLGLFATQDISPGQVILVNRALAFHQCGDLMKGGQSKPGLCRCDLVTQIANKVHFDNDLGPLVNLLFAGEELVDAPPGDVRKIEGVLMHNPYLANAGPDGDPCGFWVLPSFINHSCSERNCRYEGLNEVMIVRAVEKIPKGGEVLLPYVKESLPYAERQALLKTNYGFVCTCKLCIWELKEKDSTVGSRHAKLKAAFATKLENQRTGALASLPPHEVLSDFKFMKGLWNEVGLNGLFDTDEIHQLCIYFFDLAKKEENNPSRLKEAVKAAKFRVSLYTLGWHKVVAISNVHIFLDILGKVTGYQSVSEEILDNLKALKKEIIFWCGSQEGLSLFYEGFVQDIKNQGIDFYTL